MCTIKLELRAMFKYFENTFYSFIRWPTLYQWWAFFGNWLKIPCAVDGTCHRVHTTQIKPQEQFYSGHRKCHVIHTQIIMDTYGIIVHTESNCHGHMNDAQQLLFVLMTRRFPDEEIRFPVVCHLTLSAPNCLKFKIGCVHFSIYESFGLCW